MNYEANLSFKKRGPEEVYEVIFDFLQILIASLIAWLPEPDWSG